MKKVLLMMVLLFSIGLFTSCDADQDLPDEKVQTDDSFQKTDPQNGGGGDDDDEETGG